MRSRDENNLRQFDPWPGDPTRPPVSRGCGACGETTVHGGYRNRIRYQFHRPVFSFDEGCGWPTGYGIQEVVGDRQFQMGPHTPGATTGSPSYGNIRPDYNRFRLPGVGDAWSQPETGVTRFYRKQPCLCACRKPPRPPQHRTGKKKKKPGPYIGPQQN